MKNIIITVFFALIMFVLSALCIFGDSAVYSDSERRYLAKLPKLNKENIVSGEFMSSFETYAQDNFPVRDSFRSIKAYFATDVMQKKDNNGIFEADGHISKTDGEKNGYMLDYAAGKFSEIAEKYAKDTTKLYFSIVPDKNFFLAEKNGYPSIDYRGFIGEMKEKTPFLTYIDITENLGAEDYYFTDTHWKQENITDIAQILANKMGTKIGSDYRVNTLDIPFYGVYASQSAKKIKPDTIKYLTNDTIDSAKVTYYDTGMPKKGDMYNLEKAKGKDPYEMFLSGSTPLVTLENTKADEKRELVLFRDSFGSSIAPLLLDGYSKITVVDIRYINSGFLGGFVNFENADVLFLYSTAILNNSTALR